MNAGERVREGERSPPRALILRQELPESASIADRDVLAQVDAVAASLRRLGCETREVACSLDLEGLRRAVESWRPDFCFQLVETLGGSDRFAPLATAALETLGVPTTGAPFAAWALSNDKLRAKQALAQAGLPTPPWWSLETFHRDAPPGVVGIVKSTVEHASVGMDDAALIVAGSECDDREGPADRFVERYVEGREFNLSLLAGEWGVGVEVLPPAEIVFVDYPPDKPRIVGWAAKWDEASFEYAATPRRFDFPPEDDELLAELEALAVACWRRFGLAGWARVDFRVDAEGRPWILEANANPCLSPDAGFAAAVSRADLAYDDAIRRIVEAAFAGDGRPCVLLPLEAAKGTA